MFRVLNTIILLTAGILIGFNEELVTKYLAEATTYIENLDFNNGN